MFSSLRLTSVKGVHEHIMQMRDIVAQLKKLEVDMSESFLVHYILNILVQQYGPFKISSHVRAIGTYYLTLSSDFVLELEKTFYVPSFSRKLI
ncbi:hypothetical protein ACOSP7_031302 [Xanthoceras sorbifolium]